jgi:hypothetical protein
VGENTKRHTGEMPVWRVGRCSLTERCL